MITDGQAVDVVADLLNTVAATAQIIDPDGQALDVVVFDGPDGRAEYAPIWLAVGTPWQDDQQAVTTVEETLGAGRRARVTHSVACTGYVASGALDFTEWRRQAGQLLAAVRAHLDGDPTLSDQVARARLGADRQLAEVADQQGAAVMIGFTVELVLL
ncbi:hypothetical protein [Blastococcus sp. TF02A-26]|uniref:hypothetical protein n=1 Tax=Blastococcus sp. TF02A-26 TaxID=2250577 RepID=UPI000DEA6A6A|nr:hypothetical protein [Blastococcus sp. TF02A-26]RBY82671.1 hypothetical protein DQ240_18420 [Blastococcus sp. TF02A-26]